MANSVDSDIQILPNTTWRKNSAAIHLIEQVNCNDLTFRGLKGSQNHTLIYRPEATHTLNVLLYPYIPSAKDGNNQKIFQPLQTRIL